MLRLASSAWGYLNFLDLSKLPHYKTPTLAAAACRAGFEIYFTGLDDLGRPLKTAEAARRLPSKLGTYLRPSVLMVLPAAGNGRKSKPVSQVISLRYEKGSIILTSTKTPS